MKIGVTGGIGAGKSLVCNIFSILDVPVFDADSRAKKLMSEDPVLRSEIIDLFGDLEDQLSERHFYDLAHNSSQGTKLIGEYLAMKISHELDAMDIGTK